MDLQSQDSSGSFFKQTNYSGDYGYMVPPEELVGVVMGCLVGVCASCVVVGVIMRRKKRRIVPSNTVVSMYIRHILGSHLVTKAYHILLFK
jgi:hypothetical protein